MEKRGVLNAKSGLAPSASSVRVNANRFSRCVHVGEDIGAAKPIDRLVWDRRSEQDRSRILQDLLENRILNGVGVLESSMSESSELIRPFPPDGPSLVRRACSSFTRRSSNRRCFSSAFSPSVEPNVVEQLSTLKSEVSSRCRHHQPLRAAGVVGKDRRRDARGTACPYWFPIERSSR